MTVGRLVPSAPACPVEYEELRRSMNYSYFVPSVLRVLHVQPVLSVHRVHFGLRRLNVKDQKGAKAPTV